MPRGGNVEMLESRGWEARGSRYEHEYWRNPACTRDESVLCSASVETVNTRASTAVALSSPRLRTREALSLSRLLVGYARTHTHTLHAVSLLFLATITVARLSLQPRATLVRRSAARSRRFSAMSLDIMFHK